MRKTLFLVAVLLCVLATPLDATTWYIDPVNGNDTFNSGMSPSLAFLTIQKGLDVAQAGDVVQLASGRYNQAAVSRRDGTAAQPITITGPSSADVRGVQAQAGCFETTNPTTLPELLITIFDISHDYHVLSGFTIDGSTCFPNCGLPLRSCYFHGQLVRFNGVTGSRLLNMVIENAGRDCIGYQASPSNEIGNSNVNTCGLWDPNNFNVPGENSGECIGFGSGSPNNLVHHGQISACQRGVTSDASSGSTRVESVFMSGHRGPLGAITFLGNDNTATQNLIQGTGADGVFLNGTNNTVTNNDIIDCLGAGVSINAIPQGPICGNEMFLNNPNSGGQYGSFFNPTAPCGSGGGPPGCGNCESGCLCDQGGN